MSQRYQGAILSATPPTTTTVSAPGEWTLESQMQAQAAGTWPIPGPFYIEDVFSTWLYTGNDGVQAINNGLDLSTKGGMVWIKSRSGAYNNSIQDTARGPTQSIFSNLTDQSGAYNYLSSFNTNGFTLNTNNLTANSSGTTYVSWAFREQPKFFDVVTFSTGASTNTNLRVSHNLGSVPGCMILKRTDGAGDWPVWHRSLASATNSLLNLNLTSTVTTRTNAWGTSGPTSTDFGIDNTYFGTNATYVAYLFAHDAGGFGAAGTDNVISCGSFTTDGSGNASITLGYEPQWVLQKSSTFADEWKLYDVLRGAPVGGTARLLYANASTAEVGSSGGPMSPTATGFTVAGQASSNTFIYIAIRRGPMRTPTSGTQIYSGITGSGTGSATTITGTNFPVDVAIVRSRAASAGYQAYLGDRMRGGNLNLSTSATSPEASNAGLWWTAFDNMSGARIGTSSDANGSGINYINWFFRRAPSVMDVVCYTGTGVARTINHNLGVVPELIIVKDRSAANEGRVYAASLGNTKFLRFFSTSTAGEQNDSPEPWNNTSPTASVFSVRTNAAVNASGDTYVAYLFASCPGVSKVGSYSGTGATQTISCGFAARFVLIKRSDGIGGDWLVWDTARGMVAGTDPRLAYNSTAAEANANWVYTDASGFQIVTNDTNVNASGGTYIYLAIA